MFLSKDTVFNTHFRSLTLSARPAALELGPEGTHPTHYFLHKAPPSFSLLPTPDSTAPGPFQTAKSPPKAQKCKKNGAPKRPRKHAWSPYDSRRKKAERLLFGPRLGRGVSGGSDVPLFHARLCQGPRRYGKCVGATNPPQLVEFANTARVHNEGR